MQKRIKRKFSEEQKRKAVDEYVSGRKSAEEVAAECGVTSGMIYKWRIRFDEQAKGIRIEELESQGMSTQAARKILEQQAIIEAYEKKVAQQAIIIDLLKKLQTSASFQPESELSGLIDTTRKLARSRKPVK
jgi:transposase-like protein